MRSKAMKILLITVMLVMAVCAISSCFDARCTHECFCGNQRRYENMFGDSMFADESEELGYLTCHTDTESGYTIAFGTETEEQDESSSVVREYLYVDYDVETNEYSERILLYEYNIEL